MCVYVCMYMNVHVCSAYALLVLPWLLIFSAIHRACACTSSTIYALTLNMYIPSSMSTHITSIRNYVTSISLYIYVSLCI